MAVFRIKAVEESEKHRPIAPAIESERHSSIFGKNVFHEEAMRQYLSKDAFKAVISAIEKGTKINRGKRPAGRLRHETMGDGSWSYALYPLVPASYRYFGRKTRCIFSNR